jgi:hypothetical protein
MDGSEPLVSFGMDSTNHWWALTSPFSESYRLTVDGITTDVYKDIKELKFSPDGNRWACFVQDNVDWHLLTNDTIITIRGNQVGEIQFSPNSNHLIYSYFESEAEYLVYKDKKIRVFNRTGNYILSNNAEKIAWKSNRGNGFTMTVNGIDGEVFDDVLPFGFWYNAQLLYAIKNGDLWEVYKGEEVISESYSNIFDIKINILGNVAAFLATEQSSKRIAVLISDEYYEPLISNKFDQTYNLKLHPYLPMMAYNAKYHGQDLVLLNTAEYYGGSESTDQPYFTHDGEDLFFLGCDLHCFINVNGRKYPMNSELDINRKFAKKPSSNTLAYSTGTSMIVRNIENNELFAGMMVDEIIPPRYNWRTDRYETLGSINNRLYLMTCIFE